MAGKTNYLEGRMLDELYGGTAFAAPGTIYVGLFTAAPTDAGGGTEVTGGAYARASLANTSGNWPAATGTPRVKANGAVLTFPSPSANWGTVTHFGTFDAASGGNLLHWAALAAPKTIAGGDGAPSFAVGAITITED